MTIYFASRKRDIEINCLGCKYISLDEQDILDAIAFRMEEVDLYKQLLLSPEFLLLPTAKCVEKPLIQIATSFKNAGHLIRPTK